MLRARKLALKKPLPSSPVGKEIKQFELLLYHLSFFIYHLARLRAQIYHLSFSEAPLRVVEFINIVVSPLLL